VERVPGAGVVIAQPEELVRGAEAAYGALDIDRIMGLFDAEIVFFWNGELGATGLDQLRRWHESSFANVRDYRIRKTLRAASGDTIAVEWADSWVDAATDARREGHGAEFWIMKGNRLREWRAYWRGRTPSAD
jgi:nuclear transport factor 2 (NTF2) superfamily protein